MERQLRERALETALENPEGWLARARQRQRSLKRHIDGASRSRRFGLPLGATMLGGSAVLAGLTATAVLSSPVGWVAAGIAGLVGLFSLRSTATADRHERRARELSRSLELSHAGRALEVDALLVRMDTARNAMATDYARFEAGLMREVDPRHTSRSAENAAVLASLRSRQLDFVRRLDEARKNAMALRTRLIRAAIAEEVDQKLARVDTQRGDFDDRLARAGFEEADTRGEVNRLVLETEALEALEKEYATTA